MGKLFNPLLRFGTRSGQGDARPRSPEPAAGGTDIPTFHVPALVRAMEGTGAGIWEWDPQTNRNLWSPAVWKLYGLDPQRHPACYQSWADSIHPDDRSRATQAVNAAMAAARPFEVEWRRHGEPTAWIMARGQPDQRPDGLHYMGIVLDITERKQAEQAIRDLNQSLEQRITERTQALEDSKHLLQHILDGIPGLVGYWDQDQRNRFANKAYGEWFGQSPDEIRGRHLQELLGPTLYERNRTYIDAALRGEAQCFERVLTNVAGEARTTEAHYLPDVCDGAVRGFLVMVFDISQVKRAEQAAEAANQAKSEFLANISHELRTPLNAMFGMAQLGMHAHEGSPAARTFQQILQSGQHLMTLINDVLDFSRIEAGKMPIQQGDVDLGQLIEHVVTMSAGRAEAKGLMLRLSESTQLPRQFTGDATRCAQILLNLLGNAIKFTDQGMVQLDIDLSGDAPDTQLRFTVRDTGVGIPPDAAARLFRPFEQAHRDQNRDDGGTGLGLAISQRLARLMGGDIQFESTLGEGSTFTLTLPCGATEPANWQALAGLCLVNPAGIVGSPLQTALLSREARIRVSRHLPDPGDCPPTLLLKATPWPDIDSRELLQLAQQGCHLLIGVPASGAPAQLDGLLDHAILIHGPLSPLRILHALDRVPHQRRPATQRTRLQGLRVLAAEDNPVNRLVLDQMLIQEGAEVCFACDGVEALELLQARGEHTFDVVLCDIQMPLMDGYETTRAMAHIAPTLPVIGLTAHAFSAAREQAVAAGMVAYVTKPYMIDALVDAILRHARPHRCAPAHDDVAEPPALDTGTAQAA